MNHAKEVENFVHQCFDMYGLDFKLFFSDFVDEAEDESGALDGGERVALPIANGTEIDMEVLASSALTLGVSVDALLNMDEQAVQVWREKYPYFELRRQFESAREYSLRFTATAEKLLLWAIFGDDELPDEYKRYHNGHLKERLLDLLRSYDSVIPGCYHKDADIAKLSVRTNNFTTFESIKDLTESYLSMVDRARELFYKLWDQELSEQEKCEYNFLVSVLGMRDIAHRKQPIYYETARKFVPVYKQESFNEYSSYIIYRGAEMPPVWTCKEFYDYPELVERVVYEFPKVKAEIGRMAMWSQNFLCSFAWTDEPYPTVDVIDEEYLLGVARDFGEEIPSQYHHIYVPKSKEEIGDDAKYIDYCKKLAAPASKGGLKLPTREVRYTMENGRELTKRIVARFQLLGGVSNG